MTRLTKHFTLLFLLSCGSPPQDEAPDYRPRLSSLRASFDSSSIPPCDYLTFAPLAEAHGAQAPFADLEVEPGKWLRGPETCFVEEQPRSECSLDGYLSVVHYATVKKDKEMLRRMQAYLDDNGWKCGDGPVGITSIVSLKPLIASLLHDKAEVVSVPLPRLPGFRGYLIASYLWTKSIAAGKISLIDKGSLARQDNILSRALLGEDVIAELEKQADGGMSDYGWGSAPNALIKLLVYSVVSE